VEQEKQDAFALCLGTVCFACGFEGAPARAFRANFGTADATAENYLAGFGAHAES
jgi:hypothetical protein